MFILPERKSFGETMGENLGSGLSQGLQGIIRNKLAQRSMNAENQALEKFGINVQGISDPDLRKALVAASLQGSGQQDTMAMPKMALGRMKELIEKPGIGMAGRLNPFSEARHNRGEFEALQSSLMPLFKSMFPRGMTEKEFKYVNEHYMPQAGDTKEKMLGKIAGLEKLMGGEMSGFEMPQEQQQFSASDFKKAHDGTFLVRNKKGETGRVPADKIQQAIEMGYTPQ